MLLAIKQALGSYPGPSQKQIGPGIHCWHMLYWELGKHWEFGIRLHVSLQ